MNMAIAHEEVKSQPVTKMMSSNLMLKPPMTASSNQLSQCRRMYVSKTFVRITSSRTVLKGMDRKAPMPVLHLNEIFGQSLGELGVAVVSRIIAIALQ